MTLAHALLLLAGLAGAAQGAQRRPAVDPAAPLSGPHRAELGRLDAALAKGDERSLAALLAELQPRIDASERFALDALYVLVGRRRFAEAREQWNRLAPKLQAKLGSGAATGGSEEERRRRAAEALFVQGLLTARGGARDEALRDLRQADGYGFPPLDSPLMRLAADCLAELSEHRLAAQAYGEYLKRAPADTDARLSLAASLVLSGQVRSADAELARVREEERRAKRETPRAQFWTGALRLEQKRYDEARRHLERALELDPSCVDCVAHLAQLAYLDGDDALCASLLARAEALDASNVEAGLVAGMLANRNGRYAEAIRHLQRVVERAPGSARAQHQLALAYRRSGDAEKAREHQAIYDRLLQEQRAAGLGARGTE
jgi:tetratricopeptide (TPR) repeat protein